MNEPELSCIHLWRYYVDLAAKAVRQRVCERCGRVASLPALAPARSSSDLLLTA